MKAEETRRRLISELESQFNSQIAQEDSVINFPLPTFEKPNMFMPKESGRLEMLIESTETSIKGMGFRKSSEKINDTTKVQEIYSMKELITANPNNMRTLSYDENVLKTQLALVKRKEWQDSLFEDVDWFKQIDILGGIKRLFKRF